MAKRNYNFAENENFCTIWQFRPLKIPMQELKTVISQFEKFCWAETVFRDQLNCEPAVSRGEG